MTSKLLPRLVMKYLNKPFMVYVYEETFFNICIIFTFALNRINRTVAQLIHQPTLQWPIYDYIGRVFYYIMCSYCRDVRSRDMVLEVKNRSWRSGLETKIWDLVSRSRGSGLGLGGQVTVSVSGGYVSGLGLVDPGLVNIPVILVLCR